MIGALALGPAALANVGKSGTQPCTAHQTGVTRASSSGMTTHYPPGGGSRTFNNGSNMLATEASSINAGGGSWSVTTNGSLNNAGTYAYCIAGTP